MRTLYIALSSALTLCAVLVSASSSGGGQKPNILLLLTDDQDVTLGGLTPQAKIHSLMTDQGTRFTNAFVHTPICCPSRSSYLSGRYIHNKGALNNSVPGNCCGPDWVNGPELRTYAVHLKQAGYRTHYAGKYLNRYGLPGSRPDCQKGTDPGCNHVPPGWDNWFGLVGNSQYYNYSVIDNGNRISFGDKYATDYFPDRVAQSTLEFIHQSHASHPDDPILAVNAWPSPHGPHTPAPQYLNHFLGRQAPRPPNFNESSDTLMRKHWIVRKQSPLTCGSCIDKDFSQRWETLLSVDDHVELIIQALKDTGRLENSYILYTSDHGFQLGNHRLTSDKRHLYENDIRIPFIVRGPGVPSNQTEDAIVLNVDVAPTIVDLATGSVPDDMDGMSFKRFLVKEEEEQTSLVSAATSGTAAARDSPWRTSFLVDYHGEHKEPCLLEKCPPPKADNWHVIDGINNTYTCVRTKSSAEDTMYCEFDDSESFVEYYDLNTDPWQLDNAAHLLTPARRKQLAAHLAKLRACEGVNCRNA